MLESLVAWVLNNYLGKYVQNLNTDQLSIALLQGSVELENLPLKNDAFHHFGLPLEIKHGLIGKIKLKIPVTQLRSAPWIIVIEYLTIVLNPLSLNEWNEEAEENTAHEYKLGLLDSMEANIKASKDGSCQDSSNTSYYSWLSYGSGFVTNIIENIQLEIKKVHIRYEDNVTSENSFSLGIIIDSLTVQSCNDQWCPGYKCLDADKFSFKLLQLSGFSLYCNKILNCQFWTVENLLDLNKTEPEESTYILKPISAEARVKRNRSCIPLRSKTHPRIICDLQLENVSVSLKDTQYFEIIQCLRGLKRIQKCRKFIRFRPKCNIKNNPKEWWIYCFNCFRYKLRGTINKLISWEQCLSRARENISYVKLYSELLSNANNPSLLSSEMRLLKNKLEREREFDELKILREVAILRVKSLNNATINTKLSKSGRGTLFQWFPQWWGWYSTSEDNVNDKNSFDSKNNEVNQQLDSIEDEILDVITDTLENNTIFRRDTIFGQFNFVLKEGSFKLYSKTTPIRLEELYKCVMELSFYNVHLELESRPRSSSSRVYVSVDNVILTDYYTENSIFPVLISPQNSEDAPSGKVNRNLPPTIIKLLNQSNSLPINSKIAEPLFQLTYEYKPFTSNCDYKLHIKSQSLDIVYNAEAIKWLIDFFMKPYQKSEAELKKAARYRYHSMKQKTKEEFLKNWDNILQGHQIHRKQWDIKFDISAPQIFLVEHFTDKNTVICIVDFGKLHFNNCYNVVMSSANINVNAYTRCSTELDITEDDDENEEFATPCSTPPDSEISDASESRRISAEDTVTQHTSQSVNEASFHSKIYESYRIELSELQVLLGRMKDNWKFAHLKGTSSLHVLDKFNISLQVERRVIYTSDPQYPALMILGNLPKLIVHANEHKVQAMKSIYDTVLSYWAQTPFRTPDKYSEEFDNITANVDQTSFSTAYVSNDTIVLENNESKLFLIQFVIDQLSLEVQSRGRSIAELQVSGVKALFTQKPIDTSLSLSVHSLLLVDALQTFGPDFELLLASHKHVGMDSISGSLKDSDPTSPMSTESPDPSSVPKSKTTTPTTLLQALSTLNAKDDSCNDFSVYKCLPSSPFEDCISGIATMHSFSDNEALILIDIVFIKDRSEERNGIHENVQIASIQFNNLDVVANQESIVELISFTKRVLSIFQFNQKCSSFDLSKTTSIESNILSLIDVDTRNTDEAQKSLSHSTLPALTRTELTFDFHRLNILLLRSVTLDNGVAVARKIATATMTDAKIHATVGNDLLVEGSLGGLQVLDLTNEGHIHQRIFSVGQDPFKMERCINQEKRPSVLFEHISANMYNTRDGIIVDKLGTSTTAEAPNNLQAMNFTVQKSLCNKLVEHEHDTAMVNIKFSSALYTHAPHFVNELSNYATEFKQYLKNLARSIGSVATEMALGLVHARTEALAQSLSVSSKQSFHGSYPELVTGTPRKHYMRSPSVDFPSDVNTSFNTLSPTDYESYPIKMKLDVIVDSPVIIMPRYSTSFEVFVAHLGRISLNNEDTNEVTGEHDSLWTVKDRYNVEIRDMNLFSLNIENKKKDDFSLINEDNKSTKITEIYDCSINGKPILHDTVIRLFIERDLKIINGQSTMFLDISKLDEKFESIKIYGEIATPLKFSLTRQQYEQLIETVDNILEVSEKNDSAMKKDHLYNEDLYHSLLLPNIAEESELRSSVSALDLDPALRAKMLQRHSSSNARQSLLYNAPCIIYSVDFEVPVFTVELKADFGEGERSLVELSFRDFIMKYEKCNQFETFIQMSLQSLVMEDLQCNPNSKYRYMMTSSCGTLAEDQPNANFISTSCPNLSCSHLVEISSHHCNTVLRGGSSLPDYLQIETVFGGFMRKRLPYYSGKNNQRRKSSGSIGHGVNGPYPSTPPPSPRERRVSNIRKEDNLVHISVTLYSKDADQFVRNKLYRSVNIDFNSLNIIVNVQSWVVVLDFFGLANDQPISSDMKSNSSKLITRKQSSLPFTSSTEEDKSVLCNQQSELDVTIRSLSLILNRTEYEVAKANVSKFYAHVVKDSNVLPIDDVIMVNGEIGTMSLHDLTIHGKLYNERFITNGLNFCLKRYSSPDRSFSREYDIDLKLHLSSVMYTHTQRFTFDLQTYYKHFTQLQKLLNRIRSASKVCDDWDLPVRLHLDITAASPVIILPVHSQHCEVLIVDLGNLSITNTFKWSDVEDKLCSDETCICLLDIMEVNLVNMDLFIGEWLPLIAKGKKRECDPNCLDLGSYCIRKHQFSLLHEKCKLTLQVERNLSAHVHKAVPDLSFTGTLSTLAVTMDLSQYCLVRGLLMYNIGECLDDLFTQDEDLCNPFFFQNSDINPDFVWRTNCLHLDLVNVSVTLLSGSTSFSHNSLARVNFIKSHLNVESFSDKSQDIDLVSQEILITDTRFVGEPVNKRSNIFTNILQPIGTLDDSNKIRVEVHHRNRTDYSKFTILLNNMRLMAILDWWEMVRDFVIRDINFETSDSKNGSSNENYKSSLNAQLPFEVKLNITNSEVVILEDTTQWDSNAIIFKSTTVINYKPHQVDKLLSCNLNHCELFSCILGMEDETALSIVDPVTINVDLCTRSNECSEPVKVLQICSHQMCLRFSYHDVRMFMRILKSLHKQTAWAKNPYSFKGESEIPANIKNQIEKLQNLGFSTKDCLNALEKCRGNLNEAALWLTHNAFVTNQFSNLFDLSLYEDNYLNSNQESMLSFQLLELKMDCLNICIIDDCQDSDVPLVELSMGNLYVKRDFKMKCGQAQCSFSVDYYNRFLSGWEPFLEPWSCVVNWNHSSDLSSRKLICNLSAQDILNVNVTKTLIDLFKNVKEVWIQDYYNPKEKTETENKQAACGPYKRRSPFIPFALKNETGCLLSMSTSIAAGNNTLILSPEMSDRIKIEDHWQIVNSGETIKFSFEERNKHRHQDSHIIKHHQITIKVHGWKPVKPVSVDRVGVYFRYALPDNCSVDSYLPQARIVFDVTLQGNARKLITVRSALLLHNRLQLPVEIKLENTPTAYVSDDFLEYTLLLDSDKCVPVPLRYTHAQISLRPAITEKLSQVYYAFSDPMFWQRAQRPGDLIEETRQCHSNKGSSYRFCGIIRRENFPYDHFLPPVSSPSGIWTHPGHSITFISPMIIVNLLPYDLHYAANDVESGRIHPGQRTSLHEVSNDIVTEIAFFLESYPGFGSLIVPSPPNTFTTKLKLYDHSGRKIFLHISVSVHKGAEVKVTVYAPFWIINRTALPLVFRQEGVPSETAGQYEEHEIARMVAPLIFSLTDAEASPTVVARLGTAVHPDGIPQWCEHFHLHAGVQMRRLKVSLRDNRPDIVYMIGITIRSGRGRYRNTSVITLSSHYQIHNKSSFKLQFAQKCFASTVSDPGAQATHLQALPNCSLPFHWPRLDKDQLLCLRILDVSGCLWSGGFRVNNDAFHLNIRDQEGKMHFLRVEIVLQDATFFIIFMNAETMPPPIRIDNFSQVNLHFHQILSDKYCTVRPHSSIPYAWDEPIISHILTIIAPGGVSANYDVNLLGRAMDLTYENFIYIAFTATFNNMTGTNNENFGGLDVRQQQLVLDVLPNSARVILNKKENGARSQFWRMTSAGQLQHEGSSPPIDPRSKRTSLDDNVFVLDIAGPALQPKEYVNLALRRPSRRRISTQTWRFAEDGRLYCAHSNLCVQARDGFFGLRKGNDAVLGPIQTTCLQLTDSGIPFEQAVSRQKLRPGSGFLSVNISTDGPTRVLEITDIQDRKTCALVKDCDWVYVDKIERPIILNNTVTRSMSREFEVNIDLHYGISLSLISRKPPEELAFCRMNGICMNFARTCNREYVELTVKDIQIDNQLFEAQCDVVLYVMPNSRNTEPEEIFRPALNLSYERVLSNDVCSKAEIFKSLLIRIKNLCLILEERLLLKLIAFLGYNLIHKTQHENIEETDFETQQILADVSSIHSKRYYFEILEVALGQIRLSVLTNNKLPRSLQEIKKKLGLTLLKFEDATVDLKPFIRVHFFETSRYILRTIEKHFRKELKWRAAVILGSVDFLGNPLGFVNDLSEGVSGLIYEGSVAALVQNVTHGLSNSAAKVTETLSDGLGIITMDEQHEETRRKIRSVRSGTSGDHLVAGLKGLGVGLLGGFTSVFKQTYEGAVNEGVQGFVTGFGKGLVGTVTKPVVGMLDLASETATAVRDSSRSSNKIIPCRWRKPRCVMSPTGLLPLYSAKQSLGQELLYSINHHDYSEIFIAYEVLHGNISSSSDNFQIIVSSKKVRVFSRLNTMILETNFEDVSFCQPVIHESGKECTLYIELEVRTKAGIGETVKKPKIRCDSENIANWISEQINYAKNMYIERQYSLIPLIDNASDS